jgi:hypothetical protein
MILVVTSIVLHAQDNCRLATIKDGISISRCKVAGIAYDAVLVEFEAQGSLDQYLELATNVSNFVDWHYRIDYAEKLKQENDSTLVYRSEIDTPWPLDPREMVVRIVASRTDNGGKVQMESVPDYIPMTNGLLRIPYSKTRMEVLQVSRDMLVFTYYAEVNPGGAIPAWVANLFALNGPYQTFRGLKELLSDQNTD